jgi:hypothetical protein
MPRCRRGVRTSRDVKFIYSPFATFLSFFLTITFIVGSAPLWAFAVDDGGRLPFLSVPIQFPSMLWATVGGSAPLWAFAVDYGGHLPVHSSWDIHTFLC